MSFFSDLILVLCDFETFSGGVLVTRNIDKITFLNYVFDHATIKNKMLLYLVFS